MDFLNDSESNKIRITFPATLDFSESTAKLKTEIHFTKVIKDGRPDDFDDPNQMPLGDIPEEARPPGKRKRKPAKKKTETTDEFSGKDAASGAGKDAD